MNLEGVRWLVTASILFISVPGLAHANIHNDPNVVVMKHSGKCLSINGGSTSDGARVIQSACAGESHQLVKVRPSGDAYQLVIALSGKCVEVSDGSMADDAQIIQSTCHNGKDQHWYIRQKGDYFHLIAKHSGKCLGIKGGERKNGTVLSQWPCQDGDNQSWTIASLSHTHIVSAHSHHCIDVQNDTAEDGAALIQWTCGGGDHQQLTLMPYQDAYQIVLKHSGKCMTVQGDLTANGSAIVQWPCQGMNSQLWYPRAINQHYSFVLKGSGKCLSVKNGAQPPGEPLIQVACHGDPGQLWQINASSTTGGKWSKVLPLPLVPAAAAHLPDGKLLLWSARKVFLLSSVIRFSLGLGQTHTSIFDPVTGQATERVVFETGHDMFCPGTANLADGRILVSGGVNSSLTSIYDPTTDKWSIGQTMNIGRGYQANTVLSNGEVFTLGGSWTGGIGGKDGEIWNTTSGWRRTPGITANTILTEDAKGIYRADNHGWFFAVGHHQVFHAGPSKQMNWFNVKGGGTSTSAGLRGNDEHSMNGNATMYDIGRILKVGGGPNYEKSNASTSAYIIDVNDGVSVSQVDSMAYPRSFSNSVVLPSGDVIIFGGQSYPIPYDDLQSVLVPELWNPVTKIFTTLAPMQIPRNYHSVALLMYDGRIFVGGGGLCKNCETNHENAQIFTPPYLLKADGSDAVRPVITQSPPTAGYGTTISVNTDSTISKFVLVRSSSVTHGVNNDQRRILLDFSLSRENVYSVTIPNSRGVVVPGYYMLFAINGNGVPSVAKIMMIGKL